MQLNMRTKVREAFDNKTLQMFSPARTSARYAGPCAIGAALTPEEREKLDSHPEYASIDYLAKDGIINIPKEEILNMVFLQRTHDRANFTREASDIRAFNSFLTQLE